MTLRLSEEDTALLRSYAESQGRSMHDVVMEAVREHIATHSLDVMVDRALDDVTVRYSGALRRLGEL